MFNDFDSSIDLSNYVAKYNGKLLHSIDMPAIIYNCGHYYSIQYHINGLLHRCKKPALIEIKKDNTNYLGRVWIKNNLWHRFNAPAYISYDGQISGRIIRQEYRHYGKLA